MAHTERAHSPTPESFASPIWASRLVDKVRRLVSFVPIEYGNDGRQIGLAGDGNDPVAQPSARRVDERRDGGLPVILYLTRGAYMWRLR